MHLCPFLCVFLPFLPNDVYGLAKQYGLKEGTKLSCDNLFTSFDLCAEKGIGVIGTVRQNRIGSLPIMDKKTADKQLKRGGGRDSVQLQHLPVCVEGFEAKASNYCLPEPVVPTTRNSSSPPGPLKLCRLRIFC